MTQAERKVSGSRERRKLPLENIQSEAEQSRCLRRRELEREPK